MFAFSELYP